MQSVEEKYKVKAYPMKDIYASGEFNVGRGDIDPGSIMELAGTIKRQGLLQPVTIQPYDKDGYKYRLICGYRRFAAYEYNHETEIPAMLRTDIKGDIEAEILNFIENLNRVDLNILQEAKVVDRLLIRMDGDPGKLAKAIGRSKMWVYTRQALLSLPETIQKDAANGDLTQYHIVELAKLKDPKEQFAAVRRIKEARLNREKRIPKIGAPKPVDPSKAKRRGPQEIYDMIEYLFDNGFEGSLATRTLAWANGEINRVDYERSLMEYAKANGLSYTPPIEVQVILNRMSF